MDSLPVSDDISADRSSRLNGIIHGMQRIQSALENCAGPRAIRKALKSFKGQISNENRPIIVIGK